MRTSRGRMPKTLSLRHAGSASRTGRARSGCSGYLNHANMGNYREAISDYLDHGRAHRRPTSSATRHPGPSQIWLCSLESSSRKSRRRWVSFRRRLGWSDGRNESFAYDRKNDPHARSSAASRRGNPWHRRNDRAGVTFVANGIVAAHQQYLALGGKWIPAGRAADLPMALRKSSRVLRTPRIIWRGFFASFDVQHINNPGYNEARGSG